VITGAPLTQINGNSGARLPQEHHATIAPPIISPEIRQWQHRRSTTVAKRPVTATPHQ